MQKLEIRRLTNGSEVATVDIGSTYTDKVTQVRFDAAANHEVIVTYASGKVRRFDAATGNEVVPIPQVPVITSPATGSVTSSKPVIRWNAVDHAARYDVYIYSYATGTVIRDMNVTSASYTPASNLVSGSYQIWIRAINSNGQGGGWSSPITINVS